MLHHNSKKIAGILIVFFMLFQLISPVVVYAADPIQLIINLTNKRTGQPIPNATFTLTNGTVSKSFTTGTDGKASVSGLPAGTYTLKESANDGYLINNTTDTITIGSQNYVTNWTNNRILNKLGWSSDVITTSHLTYPDYMNAMDYADVKNPISKTVEYYTYLKPNYSRGGSTDRPTIFTINSTNINITNVQMFDVNNTATDASGELYRVKMVKDMINKTPGTLMPINWNNNVINASHQYKITGTQNNANSYSIGIPKERFTNDWGFLVKVTGTITDVNLTSNIGYAWRSQETNITTRLDHNFSLPAFPQPQAYTVNLTDIPAGKFSLRKLNESNTYLTGATFTLSGDNGFTKSLTSNGTSDMLFNNLQPGTYTLKETAAPNDYKISPRSWTVTVTDLGATIIKENLVSNPVTPPTNPTTPTIGRNISNELVLTTNTITFPNNTRDGDVNNLNFASENGIKYNLAFTKSGVNPGDYFEIKISDTIHYNMIQPDKITYPNIYGIVDGVETVIARPYLSQSTDPLKPEKVVRYTFTDAIGGSSAVNVSLDLFESINTQVVRNNGSYTFSYTLGNNVATSTKTVTYGSFATSSATPSLNVNDNLDYVNDTIGTYRQVVYVNPLGNNLYNPTNLTLGDAYQILSPTTVSTKGITDSAAYVSEYSTSYKIYEVLHSSVLSQSGVFLENIVPNGLKDVTNQYKATYATDHQTMQIPLGPLGTKRLIVVVDSSMDLSKTTMYTAAKLTDSLTHSEVTDGSGIGKITSSATGGVLNGDPLITVKNYPKPKATFRILKKENGTDTLLNNAVFSLTDVNNLQVITDVITVNGEAVFTGINPGKYILKEVTAPNGYQKTSEEWNVLIDDNAIVTIIEANKTFNTELESVIYDSTVNPKILTAIINNLPLAKLNINKIDADTKLSITDRRVEFTLIDEPTSLGVEGAKTTKNLEANGTLFFDKLKIPGYYFLRETNTPPEYIKPNYQWIIHVIPSVDTDLDEIKKQGYKIITYKAPLEPITLPSGEVPTPKKLEQFFALDSNGVPIDKTVITPLNSSNTLTIENKKQPMEFEIVKKDNKGNKILKGSLEFNIKEADYNAVPVPLDKQTIKFDDLAIQNTNNLKYQIPINLKGNYILTEKTAPAGYILSKSQYYINIAPETRKVTLYGVVSSSGEVVNFEYIGKDGLKHTVSQTTPLILYEEGKDSTGQTVNNGLPLEIINHMPEYPATGGNGIRIYLLIGATLMMLSLAISLRKRRIY